MVKGLSVLIFKEWDNVCVGRKTICLLITETLLRKFGHPADGVAEFVRRHANESMAS